MVSCQGIMAHYQLRRHHSEICRILNASDASFESLAVSLYSDGIIDESTKHSVMRTKGIKGADELMSAVTKVVEKDPSKYLEMVLDIMEKVKVLENVSQSIRECASSISTGTGGEEEEIMSSSEASPVTYKSVDDLYTEAINLRDKFQELLVKLNKNLNNIDNDTLKLKLNWHLTCEREITPEVNDLLKEIDDFTSPLKVLNCLIRSYLIGYLNYRLLDVFQGLINDKEVDEMITKYEEAHEIFLKSSDLETLAQLFLDHPTLAPETFAGLPRFTVHLDKEWEKKSAYQWSQLLKTRFNQWPPHIHIVMITKKCIIIEYSVLPCNATDIVRDLSDSQVLSTHGVTEIELSEQLREMGGNDQQLDDNTQQDSLSEDDKKEQTIVTSEKDQSTATKHTHSDDKGLEPSVIMKKNTLKAVQDEANATTTLTLLKEGSDDIHTTKADQVDIEDLDYVMVSYGSNSTPKADKMDPYNDSAEWPAKEQFDLKCMICHKKTSNPITLSCLDIYCIKCLKDQHKRQQEIRRSLTIPRRYPLLMQLGTTPPPSLASSAGTYNTVQGEGGSSPPPHNGTDQPHVLPAPLIRHAVNPPLASPSSTHSTNSYNTVGGQGNDGASDVSPGNVTHPLPTHSTGRNQVLGPWYGDDDEIVDNEWFCCPLCHVQTDLSLNDNDEEVDKHLMNRINIPLRNIDHFTSLQDNLPQGRIRCQKCNDNIATGVCYGVVCNYRPLCADCQHDHMRYAAAATARNREEGHSIIPVASMEHLKRVDETCTIKDNYERLKPHDKPRMLYCKQHDEVICRSCTVHGNKHENCEVKECVGEVHRKAKEVTEKKLHAVHQIHTSMNEALKETETRRNSLKRSIEEKKGLIEQRYAVLEQKLKDQRDSLLSDCDALYRYKLDELHHHHLKLGEIYEPMNRCIEFVTWFKETSIASEFMMLKTQINQRLDELHNEHCNDQYEPYEDDEIYFDESEFDIENKAIGRVYSTPSVKKFKLDPVKGNGVFTNELLPLSIVPRDAIENDISMYPDIQAPQLLVSIKHIDSGHTDHGCVIKHSKTGRHFVTVCPTRNGDHELSVYRPMKPPFSDRYVQQKALIHVDHGLTHSIRQQLRIVLDKIF